MRRKVPIDLARAAGAAQQRQNWNVPVASSSLVTDNFTGSNGDITGRTTTTGGKTWAPSGVGQFVIASNQLTSAAAGTATVEGGTTGYVQAAFVTLDDLVGIVAHYIDAANYIFLGKATSIDAVNFAAFQIVGGVPDITALSAALADGTTLKIGVVGTTITYYVGDVSKGTDTIDAALTAEISHGFINLAGGTAAVIDNFEMSLT